MLYDRGVPKVIPKYLTNWPPDFHYSELRGGSELLLTVSFK